MELKAAEEEVFYPRHLRISNSRYVFAKQEAVKKATNDEFATFYSLFVYLLTLQDSRPLKHARR